MEAESQTPEELVDTMRVFCERFPFEEMGKFVARSGDWSDGILPALAAYFTLTAYHTVMLTGISPLTYFAATEDLTHVLKQMIATTLRLGYEWRKREEAFERLKFLI